MTTYVFRISSLLTAVKNTKNIYLNISSGEVENRIMSIKPSFTMLKRSMKALDRLGQNISQFLWWSLPLFYPLASVGVCKNEENCGPANPYLLRDWALCSRSLICYHLSILLAVSAAASTFLFGTKNWEADQPQCRLDYRADDCLSLSLRCPRQTWKFYEIPTSSSPKSSNEILPRPRLANSLLKTER